MTTSSTDDPWIATFRSRNVAEIRRRLTAVPALVPSLMIEGAPALYWATLQGNETVVEQLLAHGAHATAPAGHEQPLIASVRRGFLRIALRLLAAGANPNVRDYNGDTALQAVAAPDSPLLRVGPYSELLGYGADTAPRDANGPTPLALASGYVPHQLRAAPCPQDTRIHHGRSPRR